MKKNFEKIVDEIFEEIPDPKRRWPDYLYRKVLEHLAIPCVDVVVLHGKEFMLVKRKNEPEKNQWWFLGGRIFKGETLEEAATRKMRDEAGLVPLTLQQLGAWETSFDTSAFGVSTQSINIAYTATVSTKEAHLDDDHETCQWFTHIDSSWHPYVQAILTKSNFSYD